MNLIFGLCFVLAASILFWLYLLVVLFVFFAGRFAWAIRRELKMRFYAWLEVEDKDERIYDKSDIRLAMIRPLPDFFRKNDKRLAILAALFTFSVAGFTYVDQRIEWMGDDNAHFKAKEYWVAGQVVLGFRNGLDLFLKPDNLVIYPFIGLQRMIYNQGVQYLPENDGEIGVWKNNWFVYPISKTMGSPRGTKSWEYSPPMINLLETAWSAIEQQASFSFADRQMETQHYYRNFAGQVFYYNYRKKHYAGKTSGSAEFFTRDESLIARSRKIVKWLNELEQKWKTSPETLTFLKKNPKVEAIRQVVCMMELYAIVTNEILTNTFSCENESVQQYLFFREEFLGKGNNKPPYQRMADRKQSKRLYDVAINTVVNRFMRYSLQKYCGLEVGGEEDMSDYSGRGVPIEVVIEKTMNNLFKEELIKLEEWNNERQHD